MYKRLLLILSIGLSHLMLAQNETIGLLFHEPTATAGYTLFTPRTSNSVYLVDNCGEQVHSWTFNEMPGMSVYLMDNGNLMRAGRDSITVLDWNNNTIWSFATADLGVNQHHDIEPMPNGNVMLLCYDVVDSLDALLNGRLPGLTPTNGVRLECLIEVTQVGINSGAIVWQWCFRDHLVQEFDSTRLNFGVVQNHPELLNFNYLGSQAHDYVHANAVEYNDSLDQLLISARHTSEIYIVDHSTTTAEAASHSGGIYGKGGDFLWRWGNPAVYDRGTAADRRLFQQHDPKWVPSGYLDEHKISVFNNGLSGTPSTVGLLNVSMLGNSYPQQQGAFLPSGFDWTWGGDILGSTVDENSRSGCHALPDGAFMICETSAARISEVSKNGDLRWSYTVPVAQVVHFQGTDPNNIQNDVFRGERYLPDHPAFVGQTLVPSGTIENVNSISDSCALLSTSIPERNLDVQVVNPIEDGVLRILGADYIEDIEIRDQGGRLVLSKTGLINRETPIDLAPGLYLLRLRVNKLESINRIVVQ